MLRNRYQDPYIVLAGDLNKRDYRKATAGYADMKPIITDPTRGRHVLDLVITNFNDMLVDAGVTDPIENKEGTRSDHKTVIASFRIPRVPTYEVREYSYYRQTEEGAIKFGDWLKKQEVLGDTTTASEKVELIHRAFQEGMGISFEWVTKKKKTSEPPWMTDHIRKWIARRRGVFRKEGRSERWKCLKKSTNNMIRERRRNFNLNIRDKFLNNADSKSFHKGVKCFLSSEEAAQWDARSLFPGEDDLGVANKLADYFNGISMEYDPLDMDDLPKTYDRPFPALDAAHVAKKLRAARKTTSRVQGDIFPKLVRPVCRGTGDANHSCI